MSNGELHQKFSQNVCGVITAFFAGEMEISVLLDNGCTFYISTKHVYGTYIA